VIAEQPMSRPLLTERESVGRPLRAAAMLVALYVGGVHLALAQDRYELDSRWIGIVFVLGALVLIIAAGVAASGVQWGRPLMWLAWLASAGTCAAFFALFLLSRTAGLPGYARSDWPAEQVVALVLEAAFVVLAAVAAGTARRTTAG
jgi:hypothetical protein